METSTSPQSAAAAAAAAAAVANAHILSSPSPSTSPAVLSTEANDLPSSVSFSSSICTGYRGACSERGLVPDASLCKALSSLSSCDGDGGSAATKGDDTYGILHVDGLAINSNGSVDGHVTALIHALTTYGALSLYEGDNDELQHVQDLHISSCGSLSAATVGTLATYLTHQTHLVSLSIQETALPKTSAETLLTALLARRGGGRGGGSPLRRLGLVDVGLRARDAGAIGELLRLAIDDGLTGGTEGGEAKLIEGDGDGDGSMGLCALDVTNNSLNWDGIQRLKRCVPDTFSLEVGGNLVRVERWNYMTHGVGAMCAAIGGVVMLRTAWENHYDEIPILISLFIFIGSLFTLFCSSCAYHACFRQAALHARLRRLDHMSIFILIAGSYTPFLAAFAGGETAGMVTMCAVWGCALVGVVRSLKGRGSNTSRALFALATGWSGVMAIPAMRENMPDEALMGVVVGGVAYSIGMGCYLAGKKGHPMWHVVWHFAVMLGGGCHFATLWRYVVSGGGDGAYRVGGFGGR